jgi:hypothetical protein
MGMFDYLKCKYPLPESAPSWVTSETEFQTKDTDAQYLEYYTITEEGRLIHHGVRYETVPEEDRPYYGKPEWETLSLFRLAGSIGSVPTGDIVIEYHGDLNIYAMNTEKQPYEFYECVVRFNNGIVQYIKEVDKST